MVLSPEHEAQLVEQNMKKIYRAVDNFMARCPKDSAPISISYDDCVQEVAIEFIKYIRRCETIEQVNRFPWHDAIHALSIYVLGCQPVSFPKSTKTFRYFLNSVPHTVSFDVLMSQGISVDGMSKQWVPDTDTKLDFDSFMSNQSENVQRIASMRIYGMTQRDIASQFGVCKRAIDKKIAKLREDYDEFAKGDDEDE